MGWKASLYLFEKVGDNENKKGTLRNIALHTSEVISIIIEEWIFRIRCPSPEFPRAWNLPRNRECRENVKIILCVAKQTRRYPRGIQR